MTHRKHLYIALVAVLLGGGKLALAAAPISGQARTAPAPARTKVATIPVAGMTCGVCAAPITDSLDHLVGVATSSVDLALGQVVVRFDPDRVAIQKLFEAIAAVGYEPGKPVVRDT